MELLRGESLGEVLGREGRIDVLRAVSTLLPIMDGLREAHDKGIVHRDIKPENLFISKADRGRLQPKVLDFGIAKLEQQTDSNTKLTQDGAVLGSPGYFSPEQARGQTDIDYRTDIWSISVVLYELITGELPFTGPNYNALLMSILKDTPTSLMEHGFGDEELWEVVKKGLHRDRDQRWPSMWDLGRALARWLYNQGVRADVASRSLKEVWLESRTGNGHTEPPATFAADGGRRQVLSTLVKRRATDTLAGETMSALAAHRRFSTRALGGGAAAIGLGALLLSFVVRGSNGSDAQAAGTEPGTALTAVDQPSTPATPPPASSAAANAAPVDRDAQRAAPSAPTDIKSPAAGRETPESADTPQATRVTGARTRPRATTKPKPTVRRAKPRAASPRTTAASPRPAAPRKRVDSEFGF
jgi:serine/threonine-protein kinase